MHENVHKLKLIPKNSINLFIYSPKKYFNEPFLEILMFSEISLILVPINTLSRTKKTLLKLRLSYGNKLFGPFSDIWFCGSFCHFTKNGVCNNVDDLVILKIQYTSSKVTQSKSRPFFRRPDLGTRDAIT